MHFIKVLEQIVAAQDAWVLQYEKSIVQDLQQAVHERLKTELAVSERVVELVQTCIADFSPIKEQWQIVSDGIVIRQERLVLPPDAEPIVPSTNTFHQNSINTEQSEMIKNFVEQTQLGDVILEQDIAALTHQLCSSVGPLGHFAQQQQHASFRGICFPKKWRHSPNEIMSKIYQKEFLQGTNEHSGVMASGAMLHSIASLDGTF